MDAFGTDVERTHKILVVLALPLFLVAATAAPTLFRTPPGLCFTSGSATYQLSHSAPTPDFRIRIDNRAERPDLRMQLVDRPEIADFVLADDFGGRERSACRSSIRMTTVKVDGDTDAPDVTITLSADAPAPDYRVYVHSGRYSHQDAAALLAAMWKAAERRRIAGVPGQPLPSDGAR